jgi:putative PIN family toxin of toxin-antitoxin system
MKVFFDTNVYVAEALLGGAAEQMVSASITARWRIFSSLQVLSETQRILIEKLGFSHRFGLLTRKRIRRRAAMVDSPVSRHVVAGDPADNSILQAALKAGADFLVTNDKQLLALNPYESLRIISMADYFDLLKHQGLR